MKISQLTEVWWSIGTILSILKAKFLRALKIWQPYTQHKFSQLASTVSFTRQPESAPTEPLLVTLHIAVQCMQDALRSHTRSATSTKYSFAFWTCIVFAWIWFWLTFQLCIEADRINAKRKRYCWRKLYDWRLFSSIFLDSTNIQWKYQDDINWRERLKPYFDQYKIIVWSETDAMDFPRKLHIKWCKRRRGWILVRRLHLSVSEYDMLKQEVDSLCKISVRSDAFAEQNILFLSVFVQSGNSADFVRSSIPSSMNVDDRPLACSDDSV